MSEIVHSPYEHTSRQITREAMEHIKNLDDSTMFYTRLTQIIEGAVFEGIHFGLNVAGTFDAQGPAELLTAYNAGVVEGRKEGQE